MRPFLPSNRTSTRSSSPLLNTTNSINLSKPLSEPFTAHLLTTPTGDFVEEIWGSWRFYILTCLGRKPKAVDPAYGPTSGKPDFGTAFGIDGYTKAEQSPVSPVTARRGTAERNSYDEEIRLAPYSYEPERRRT